MLPCVVMPFEQVYTDYYRYIYQRILGLVKQREEAENLTQDTFLKAWRAYPPPTTDHLGGWLSRIAINTVIDAARKTKRLPTISLEATEADQWLIEDTSTIRLLELHEELSSRLPLLSDKHRHMLLAFALGYSIQEIAEQCSMQPSSIQKCLSKTRRRLRHDERQEASFFNFQSHLSCQ